MKWFSPSFGQGSLKIRPYLGEQLAFYFKFVAHLAQSMLVPGVVGVLFLRVCQETFLSLPLLEGMRPEDSAS